MTYKVAENLPLSIRYIDGTFDVDRCNFFYDHGPFKVDGVRYRRRPGPDQDVYGRNMFDLIGDADAGKAMRWTPHPTPTHEIDRCAHRFDVTCDTPDKIRQAHENLCVLLQTPYDGRSSP